MKHKTGKHLTHLALALLLGAAALHAQPQPAAMEKAVAAKFAEVTGGYYTLEKITFEPVPSALPGKSNVLRYAGVLESRLAQPLYSAVLPHDYMELRMKRDATSLREAGQLLAGPEGPEIRRAMPREAASAAFDNMQLLIEVTGTGAPLEFAVVVEAQYQENNEWKYDVTTLEPQTALPRGAPRAAYKGATYNISSSADIAAIDQKMREAQEAANLILKKYSAASLATSAVAAHSPDVTVAAPSRLIHSLVENSVEPAATVTLADVAPTPTLSQTYAVPEAYDPALHTEIPAAPSFVEQTVTLTLPAVLPSDAKAYAYAWDGAQWQILPRNEARIFDGAGYDGLPSNGKKQLTGTLLLDGCYQVPVVSGENVILAFRHRKKFKTFEGLPENESGFEVVKLDVAPGVKKGTLVRTATLERLGESAATFGDKREAITVENCANAAGIFWVIQVQGALAPGRYALYLPDRAFEFEAR